MIKRLHKIIARNAKLYNEKSNTDTDVKTEFTQPSSSLETNLSELRNVKKKNKSNSLF